MIRNQFEVLFRHLPEQMLCEKTPRRLSSRHTVKFDDARALYMERTDNSLYRLDDLIDDEVDLPKGWSEWRKLIEKTNEQAFSEAQSRDSGNLWELTEKAKFLADDKNGRQREIIHSVHSAGKLYYIACKYSIINSPLTGGYLTLVFDEADFFDKFEKEDEKEKRWYKEFKRSFRITPDWYCTSSNVPHESFG